VPVGVKGDAEETAAARHAPTDAPDACAHHTPLLLTQQEVRTQLGAGVNIVKPLLLYTGKAESFRTHLAAQSGAATMLTTRVAVVVKQEGGVASKAHSLSVRLPQSSTTTA
jgi:hypothetical protein